MSSPMFWLLPKYLVYLRCHRHFPHCFGCYRIIWHTFDVIANVLAATEFLHTDIVISGITFPALLWLLTGLTGTPSRSLPMFWLLPELCDVPPMSSPLFCLHTDKFSLTFPHTFSCFPYCFVYILTLSLLLFLGQLGLHSIPWLYFIKKLTL